MKNIQIQLKKKICTLLESEFPVFGEDIIFSIPSNRKYGDLSVTLPFVLAKRIKEKPFVIGQKIVSLLDGRLPMIEKIQPAGGGFVNFFFNRNQFLKYLLEKDSHCNSGEKEKIVIEHTSINPNKSAHIGHLRNSCLGDTLGRCFQLLGYEVEVQNYIDDTGIQVADVVWGLMRLEKKDIGQIEDIGDLAGYLWTLYSRASSIIRENETAAEERNLIHQKIENKNDPEYSVADYVSRTVLADHLRVMEMLGIRYDLLVRERDIIELDFFKKAAEILKKKGIMYLSEDPEKAGCWVIRYRREDIEKVIVRSNGTATYIAKDLAYTFWKVGVFDLDFFYGKFDSYADGQTIYTTDFTARASDRFRFGRGKRVFNVIDVRQSYLQNIISQVLNDLTASKGVFSHFSYEMVALTPRCVKELGLPLASEDEKRSYVEVSGRKGIAVKAEELVAKLQERATAEVRSRNALMEPEQVNRIARDIAVGALRYFMIKFNSNAVIAFDFRDALAFEGETGPYLQYTMVRINSILSRIDQETMAEMAKDVSFEYLDPKEAEICYEFALLISNLENQVQAALDNRDLSGVSNYTYTLCQKFNHFYHLFPVVSEKNPQLKKMRFELVQLAQRHLRRLLDAMGIPIPEKM